MKLSVVIPTRNRAQLLKKALDSILVQTLSQNEFEVIVIDNGSSDNTKEVIKSFNSKIDSLIFIYNETPGLHIGRHEGMKNSTNDILVYLDDDVELFPTHLENVLKSFEDEEVVLVGGKNLPNFESEPPLWLKEMWQEKDGIQMIAPLSIIDYGEKIKEIDPNYIWGCNFSIKKEILIKAGGFHPDSMPEELIKYRGDGETAVSNFIKQNNLKALYNPLVSLYHFVPNMRMTNEYFCKRMYNQGISDSYTDIRNKVSLKDINDKINKLKNSKTCYSNGYIYHQEECSKDLKLLDWILKENYYD